MAEEYRFKKRAEGPQFEQADELVLWAGDDGSMRTTDEDGTVVEIGAGGGGSAPDLAQVLAEGNDAGTADILGVGDLAANSATLAEIHGVAFLTYTAGPSILPLGGDPTAGGGTPAPVGSLGLRTNGQKWSKTGAGDTAWEQLGASEPQFLFASDTDPFITNPGVVVAGAVWMDTTHEPATLKVRDSTNSFWAFTVHMGELDFGGSPEGGVDGATYYRFTPFSGGFTIEEDGSKINCDTPLDMQGTGILASGDIDLDGDNVLNVGTITPSSPPELPASPTEQDIADALVTLGLCTQVA